MDTLGRLDEFPHSTDIVKDLEFWAQKAMELLPPHYPADKDDAFTPHWDGVPCCFRCGYRKTNHNHDSACPEFVDTPEHLRF